MLWRAAANAAAAAAQVERTVAVGPLLLLLWDLQRLQLTHPQLLRQLGAAAAAGGAETSHTRCAWGPPGGALRLVVHPQPDAAQASAGAAASRAATRAQAKLGAQILGPGATRTSEYCLAEQVYAII